VPTHIRWALRADLPAALAIEAASYADGDRWTEDDFLKCLRQRNCIMMVATRGDTIVGFMVYELHPNRMDVLNLAVAHTWRGMGVGTALVDKMKYKLCSHRRPRLMACVRETDDGAIGLFRRCGFRATALLRGHYGTEDGYAMVYRPTAEEWAAHGGAPVDRRVSGCDDR
jgi:ribosomal-protein-alanine N-acetyltransferase